MPETTSPQAALAPTRGRAALLRGLRALEPLYRERIGRFIAERPIGVGVPGTAVERVLEDGRFRTQFETGTSRGHLGEGGAPSELRITAEQALFGLPPDADPTSRPVYGALRTARPEEAAWGIAAREGHRWPEHYGNFQFLLSPEAKARSTYTWDDSLQMGALASGAEPHPDPRYRRAYRFDEAPLGPRDLAVGRLGPRGVRGGGLDYLADDLRHARTHGVADPEGFSMRALDTAYIETQTPGPVTTGDVSALLVPAWNSRDATVRGLARERGIPVFDHAEVAEDQGLQRALGLRAAAGAAGAGAAFEGLVGGGGDAPAEYAEGGLVGAARRVGALVQRAADAARGLPAVEGFRPVFPQPQRMMPEGERVPGGRYLEMPDRRDVTGEVRGGARIEIGADGRPVFLASPDVAEASLAGPRVRSNLFRRSAGWDWVGDPPEGAAGHPFLVSVEAGNRHHYALGTDFEGPVEMARYPAARSEPRLRPTARGHVELGQEVGRIAVRGVEHPVYDRVYVVRPGDAVEPVQRGLPPVAESEPEGYADGGRVGGLSAALSALYEAARRGEGPLVEGAARRTRSNPRGLPMDAAARRERAEALGFNLDDVTYHGTSADADFRAFRNKDRGVWSAANPATASRYAASNDLQRMAWRPDGSLRPVNTAGRVIPLVSRARNAGPLSFDAQLLMDQPGSYERAQAAAFRQARWTDRQDGVEMPGGVRVDLDVRNLRVPHATFDPERAHEPDLLAGLGAGAVGAGAAFEGLVGGGEAPVEYAEGGRVGRVGAVGRGLDAAAEAIRAWHGSPHRFDRFDISKIGTGEGNQAYGHGLYFAEAPDVAREYRRSLARNSEGDGPLWDGRPYGQVVAERPGDLAWERAVAEAGPVLGRTWQRMDRFGHPVDADLFGAEARAALEQEARDGLDQAEQVLRMAGRHPGKIADRELRYAQGDRDFAASTADFMRELAARRLEFRPPGALYEVDLRVSPERLLDLDEPIREQPAAAALEAARDRFARRDFQPRTDTEAQWWDAQQGMLQNNEDALDAALRGGGLGFDAITTLGRKMGAGNAAATLRREGIEGTRYLDGLSRRHGEGTRNYVLFDDEPVEIVRRYADGGRVGGLSAALSALYEAVRRGEGPLVEGAARRTRSNPRGLPMDAASRRERAEALGFNLDDVTYHGTPAAADFRGFRHKDRGVWSARDPAVAAEYAGDPEDRWAARNTASRIIPLVSRAENAGPLSFEAEQRLMTAPGYERAQAEEFRRARWADRRDAIEMPGGVRVDLDVRNLRVPHATFDPERAHEPDLLAGLGAGAVAAGSAFEGLVGGGGDEPARYAEGGLVGVPAATEEMAAAKGAAQRGLEQAGALWRLAGAVVEAG